jgi:hypothetical protein
MKLKYEIIDESELDIEDLEVERDMQLAAVDAIRRARRFGTFYVIMEGDEVKNIPPDKTAPYEERLLATADRLNRRIAELRGPAQNIELNDKPAGQK